MSDYERGNQKREIPGISEEALKRGNEFTDGLLTLQKSLEGLSIKQDYTPAYHFDPEAGQYMVVIPRLPIERKTVRITYHEPPEVCNVTTTSDPTIISKLEIKGLVSHGEDKDLKIVGTSPKWMTGNGYATNSWREEYTFNPLEHQIAIVDETTQA